jgi:hypothetical protein
LIGGPCDVLVASRSLHDAVTFSAAVHKYTLILIEEAAGIKTGK